MSFDIKLIGGDIAIGLNGDLQTVEREEKLVQDVLKMISTELGANKKFPDYGCPISKSMIGKAYDTVFVSNVAQEQLRTSLDVLIKYQAQQLRSGQRVTPQEQLAAVKRILIEQNPEDPRFFNMFISVISKAFQRVDIPTLSFAP